MRLVWCFASGPLLAVSSQAGYLGWVCDSALMDCGDGFVSVVLCVSFPALVSMVAPPAVIRLSPPLPSPSLPCVFSLPLIVLNPVSPVACRFVPSLLGARFPAVPAKHVHGAPVHVRHPPDEPVPVPQRVVLQAQRPLPRPHDDGRHQQVRSAGQPPQRAVRSSCAWVCSYGCWFGRRCRCCRRCGCWSIELALRRKKVHIACARARLLGVVWLVFSASCGSCSHEEQNAEVRLGD